MTGHIIIFILLEEELTESMEGIFFYILSNSFSFLFLLSFFHSFLLSFSFFPSSIITDFRWRMAMWDAETALSRVDQNTIEELLLIPNTLNTTRTTDSIPRYL